MTTVTINNTTYTVSPPKHDMDLNYHFMTSTHDNLVDIQDIMEWLDLDNGATINHAIQFVKQSIEDNGYNDSPFWKINKLQEATQ